MTHKNKIASREIAWFYYFKISRSKTITCIRCGYDFNFSKKSKGVILLVPLPPPPNLASPFHHHHILLELKYFRRQKEKRISPNSPLSPLSSSSPTPFSTSSPLAAANTTAAANPFVSSESAAFPASSLAFPPPPTSTTLPFPPFPPAPRYASRPEETASLGC